MDSVCCFDALNTTEIQSVFVPYTHKHTNDIKLRISCSSLYALKYITSQCGCACMHKYANNIILHNVRRNVHRGSYDALQKNQSIPLASLMVAKATRIQARTNQRVVGVQFVFLEKVRHIFFIRPTTAFLVLASTHPSALPLPPRANRAIKTGYLFCSAF